MSEAKNLFFFDTETTGVPVWKEPSEGDNQPHLVQIAAELVDNESREVIESMDVIIRPDGWTIPEETIELHGITEKIASEQGIPEKEAVQMFLNMHNKAILRVAHNKTFDERLIRIALKRYYDDIDSEEPQPSDIWKAGEGFCTMWKTKKALGLKKIPTLAEALEGLTGRKLEGAHNAENDTKACRDIYFALMDLERKEQ